MKDIVVFVREWGGNRDVRFGMRGRITGSEEEEVGMVKCGVVG